MSKHKEYEDGEIYKLDEDFKFTLTKIRPHILGLRSNECTQLCKFWLDKLCNLSTQRLLRNQYLVELRKQLESGCLHGIFSRPPPSGLLLPLSKLDYTMYVSSSVSDISEYNSKHYKSCRQWHGRTIYPNRTSSRGMYSHVAPEIIKNRSCHSVNASRTVRFEDENKFDKRDRMSHDSEPEDFSDHQHCASCDQLNVELRVLKEKLTQVETLRSILESTQREVVWYYHNLVADFFTELKLQLEECNCNQNTDDVLTKIQEIIQGKEDEVREAEKLLVDKLNIVCKQYEEGSVSQIKDFFENSNRGFTREAEQLAKKIQDLETKLVAKDRDEGKLQLMLEEQHEIMKEVFIKMKSVADLTRQKDNQRLLCTISALKKALTKSEMSRHRLTSECEKKIMNISKSRELEITTLQLQLREQKNELSSSLSSEKQCEVDSIANLLEERYKTLLSKAQTDAEKQHLEDLKVSHLKKIAALEDEIQRLKRLS